MMAEDEDFSEETQGKRGKKDRKTKPLPATAEEVEALIRR